jgi:hypothetical protein
MNMRLQTETAVNNTGQAATELDTFPPSPRLRRTGLPAILPASPGFAATGDRAWTSSLPARLGFALSLCEIRRARSQRARLKGEL